MEKAGHFDRWYNVEVAGAIGKIIFGSVPMSMEEARGFWERGIPVPLDIMPVEYWHQADPDTYNDTNGTGDFIMPFSEEALGDAF